MLLSAFIDDVYCLEKAVSEGHCRQLHISARRFGVWLGHLARLRDFTDTNVSKFLLWLEEIGRKPRYRKKVKGDLLAMWRYAVEAEMLDHEPKRIRRVHCPKEIPRAWTLEELADLIRQARTLTGYYSTGISRAGFWELVARLGYETGFRRSDLIEIRFDEVERTHFGAIIYHVHSKTGVGQLAVITHDTVAAIDAIANPKRDAILEWPFHEWTFRQDLGRLVDAAGLDGTSKFLRRSCASYGAREENEERAMKLLGHLTPGLARKHYIDPRIADQIKPVLPRIPV